MVCIIAFGEAMKLVYYRGEKDLFLEYCVALRAGYMGMNAVSDILFISSFYLLFKVLDSVL